MTRLKSFAHLTPSQATLHPLEVWTTRTTDEEEDMVTVWTDNEFTYVEWREAQVYVAMEAGQNYYVNHTAAYR